MHALIGRAKDAGYRVLCITVDLAVQGRRERDVRNAFTVPLRPSAATVLDLARRPRWLAGVLLSPPSLGNFESSDRPRFTSVAQHVATLFDPSVTWDDLARLRDQWSGPLVIKGVLHPDDARKAVEIGAHGVIVSNHGGRQLDHVPAPISALPDIVSAVGGRAEIILDGGVRRGTDILKALALGASACSIGRPFLWGLCAAGRDGVARSIEILRDELDNAMTLLGTARSKTSPPRTFAPATPEQDRRERERVDGRDGRRPRRRAGMSAQEIVEDAVGEPDLGQLVPDILDRVQLRGARGSRIEVMLDLRRGSGELFP
jgi:L-lactate dehydrogenase (cytochrome)/(S)-mandelate dehydrogenase